MNAVLAKRVDSGRADLSELRELAAAAATRSSVRSPRPEKRIPPTTSARER